MSIPVLEHTSESGIPMYAAIPDCAQEELHMVMGFDLDLPAVAPKLVQSMAWHTGRAVFLYDPIGSGNITPANKSAVLDGVTLDRIDGLQEAMYEDAAKLRSDQEGRWPLDRGGDFTLLGHCASSPIVAAIAVETNPRQLILVEPMGMDPDETSYRTPGSRYGKLLTVLRLREELNTGNIPIKRTLEKHLEMLEIAMSNLPEELGKSDPKNHIDPRDNRSNVETDTTSQKRKGAEMSRPLRAPVKELLVTAACLGVKITFISEPHDLLAREAPIIAAAKEMEDRGLPVRHISFGRSPLGRVTSRAPYGHGKFTTKPDVSSRLVSHVLDPWDVGETDSNEKSEVGDQIEVMAT